MKNKRDGYVFLIFVLFFVFFLNYGSAMGEDKQKILILKENNELTSDLSESISPIGIIISKNNEAIEMLGFLINFRVFGLFDNELKNVVSKLSKDHRFIIFVEEEIWSLILIDGEKLLMEILDHNLLDKSQREIRYELENISDLKMSGHSEGEMELQILDFLSLNFDSYFSILKDIYKNDYIILPRDGFNHIIKSPLAIDRNIISTSIDTREDILAFDSKENHTLILWKNETRDLILSSFIYNDQFDFLINQSKEENNFSMCTRNSNYLVLISKSEEYEIYSFEIKDGKLYLLEKKRRKKIKTIIKY